MRCFPLLLLVFSQIACGKSAPSEKAAEQGTVSQTVNIAQDLSKAATPVDAVAFPADISGTAPAAIEPLPVVIAAIRRIAQGSDLNAVKPYLSQWTLKRFQVAMGSSGSLPLTKTSVLQMLKLPIDRVIFQGGRAAILHGKGINQHVAWFYLENAAWKFDPTDGKGYDEAADGDANALNLPVELTTATANLQGSGGLVALIQTSVGEITCALRDDVAPKTVANFVALARGLRGFHAREGWQRRPFYDGLTFHRTVPGLLIQAGDLNGKGNGNAGFQIGDELDLRLRHSTGGVLAMDNLGPNSASAQFYITEKPAPWLDDRRTIFGLCQPLDVISAISKRPVGTVRIDHVLIQRGLPPSSADQKPK